MDDITKVESVALNVPLKQYKQEARQYLQQTTPEAVSEEVPIAVERRKSPDRRHHSREGAGKLFDTREGHDRRKKNALDYTV